MTYAQRCPTHLKKLRSGWESALLSFHSQSDAELRSAISRHGPAGAVLAPAAAIWLGKRFDADHESGANVFSSRVHTLGRVLTPAAYRVSWPEDTRSYRALAFATSVGPGALDPGVEVLRIDYDLPANAPPFRRILDELVEVEPGVYLGQALLRRGGRHRRLAWFTLEA